MSAAIIIGSGKTLGGTIDRGCCLKIKNNVKRKNTKTQKRKKRKKRKKCKSAKRKKFVMLIGGHIIGVVDS
jgi:hypothetical protein